jgi:tol-pal system protein YbgF
MRKHHSVPWRVLGTGVVILTLLSCSSCVTDEKLVNSQIRALNQKIDHLKEMTERRFDNEVDTKLTSIREQQAETEIRIGKLMSEVQRLSGQFDENNHLVQLSSERDFNNQDDLKMFLAEMDKRMVVEEEKSNRLYSYLGLEPSSQPSQKKMVKGATPVQQAEEKVQKPVATVPPDKKLYELNLSLYQGGKYEEAIAGFKNFLSKYPKSNLADNAQFWVGECYMSLGKYEQAILAYQDVMKKYSKGNKVPGSMLRQAIAFYEIKDKTSAKLLLKKLIKRYPKSKEAAIAKKKLKTIK